MQAMLEMTYCVAMVPTIHSKVAAEEMINGEEVEMIHVTTMMNGFLIYAVRLLPQIRALW